MSTKKTVKLWGWDGKRLSRLEYKPDAIPDGTYFVRWPSGHSGWYRAKGNSVWKIDRPVRAPEP